MTECETDGIGFPHFLGTVHGINLI